MYFSQWLNFLLAFKIIFTLINQQMEQDSLAWISAGERQNLKIAHCLKMTSKQQVNKLISL